jgi:hypothetical protein
LALFFYRACTTLLLIRDTSKKRGFCPRFRCFHNRIILIVNCFKKLQDKCTHFFVKTKKIIVILRLL